MDGQVDLAVSFSVVSLDLVGVLPRGPVIVQLYILEAVHPEDLKKWFDPLPRNRLDLYLLDDLYLG